jgi:transposase InsO family protein
MCRVLTVSPSGFYTWLTRAPSARAIADERLMLNIRVAHERSDQTYGAPRIQRDLRDDGVAVGTKRVARLMRHAGLVGQPSHRRRPRTTDSAHADPIAPNVLDRRFDVSPVDELGVQRLDRVWVSDLTYVPTREGWLYLAVVLDLASRRIVGWAMGPSLEVELALGALRMAIAARRPARGLLHHSDRGSQYAGADYAGVLAAHGMLASMSRKGDCWDNAVAESFFATLERELIARRDWRTRTEARQAIFHYIEARYNLTRRHSTLGYVSPAQYERQLRSAA